MSTTHITKLVATANQKREQLESLLESTPMLRKAIRELDAAEEALHRARSRKP
jgi:prefoldin subunit 5